MRRWLPYSLALAMVAAATLPTPEIAAQDSFYVRLSAGRAEVSPPTGAFEMDWATRTGVTLGRDLGQWQAVELGLGYLEREETEEWGGPDSGEAPLHVRVQAFPLQVSYRVHAPTPLPWLRPFATVGLDWILVNDRYRSDTPAERSESSLRGAHVTLGVEMTVRRRAFLDLRGSRNFLDEPADRPGPNIGLEGYGLELGLGLRF